MNSTVRNVATYFSIVSLDVDSSDGRVLFLHNLHSWHEPGDKNIVGHVLHTYTQINTGNRVCTSNSANFQMGLSIAQPHLQALQSFQHLRQLGR